MHINKETGLLNTANYIASPNKDLRSGEHPMDLIVIHNISLPPAQFSNTEDSTNWVAALFTNTLPADADPYFKTIHELKVSSHLYIRRNGELYQFVPFHQRAWHAGVSSYQNRMACNDFSIGIELEGTDDIAYETVQYEVLAEIIETLCSTYPELTKHRVAGHCHIAPKRKTDPGRSFDWSRLKQMLNIEEFESA